MTTVTPGYYATHPFPRLRYVCRVEGAGRNFVTIACPPQKNGKITPQVLTRGEWDRLAPVYLLGEEHSFAAAIAAAAQKCEATA